MSFETLTVDFEFDPKTLAEHIRIPVGLDKWGPTVVTPINILLASFHSL